MTILTGVKNSLFFRRSTQVKKKNHFEDDLQVQCVRWFDLQYPKLDLFHIPNGGSRNRKISKKGVVYSPEATRFKAMGVRAGVLDLFLMEPRGGYHGLWIEMKWGDNTWTDSQIAFGERAKRKNYKVEECRSFEKFKIIIEEYLKL